ncbi:uncharacterized protein [Nicotiana sylvestris]|uniref:uncharacterized protein n=1 Tax=Nicotiana sylvestris TaxID=4096 RepID=UPI00388C7BA6
MEFQVLDVAVSYNLLIGQPWIHAAKAVPFTLHQMVKFEWDMQEIVVHGEENLCAHSDDSIPFIEAEDDKGPQGIIQPVSLPENLGTFGLGFKPTATNVKKAKREEIVKALFEYKDIFAWSYDDMLGLSTDLVIHKLPIDPAFPPIKQKLRKFKTDMSVKIKEEVIKQLDAKVIRVKQYPTWLANVVPVPKKDGKTRVCVDYHDLNKASPKDNFPLPNIHILIDNCAKHETGSFMD